MAKTIKLKIAGFMGNNKTVDAIPVKETLSGFRFFTHVEDSGKVTVSEYRTGLHCCTEPDRELAIARLKIIYAKYGDKAFSEKIRKGYDEYPVLNKVQKTADA